MNYNEIVTQIERSHAISETIGKLDSVNADLDALLAQIERLSDGFEVLNEGLREVKRAYRR